MIVYHSGMDSTKESKMNVYGKINIMTTFLTFSKGKSPKLLLNIVKSRKEKHEDK